MWYKILKDFLLTLEFVGREFDPYFIYFDDYAIYKLM